MYYNIIIFFIICCHTYRMHHQCYRSEIFPNTIILLKVNRFEGFSNRSNVNEFVINSMSGCNCNNYKLNNSNCTLNILNESSVLLF